MVVGRSCVSSGLARNHLVRWVALCTAGTYHRQILFCCCGRRLGDPHHPRVYVVWTLAEAWQQPYNFSAHGTHQKLGRSTLQRGSSSSRCMPWVLLHGRHGPRWGHCTAWSLVLLLLLLQQDSGQE